MDALSGRTDTPAACGRMKRANMVLNTLALGKGEHRYVFRYESGREEEVIDAIIRLAEDPHTDVDWTDAAILGFQVAQHSAQHCRSSMIPADMTQYGFGAAEGDEFGLDLSDATDGPCDSCH